MPPANFREKKESDTHKKSSPFVSMWYIWGGTERMNQRIQRAIQERYGIDSQRRLHAASRFRPFVTII